MRNIRTAIGALIAIATLSICAFAQNSGSITGTIKIKVRVDVDDSGKVTRAKLAAPVQSRYFADHSLEAAKAWEFTPPQVDGKPAASAWELQFRLQRGGTHASAQRLAR